MSMDIDTVADSRSGPSILPMSHPPLSFRPAVNREVQVPQQEISRIVKDIGEDVARISDGDKIEAINALKERVKDFFSPESLQNLRDLNVHPITLRHHFCHILHQVMYSQFSRAEQLGLGSDMHIYLHGTPMEVFERVSHVCEKPSRLHDTKFGLRDLPYLAWERVDQRIRDTLRYSLTSLAPFTKRPSEMLIEEFEKLVPRLSQIQDSNLEKFTTLCLGRSNDKLLLEFADRDIAGACARVHRYSFKWSSDVPEELKLDMKLVSYVVKGQPVDIVKYYLFYRNEKIKRTTASLVSNRCPFRPHVYDPADMSQTSEERRELIAKWKENKGNERVIPTEEADLRSSLNMVLKHKTRRRTSPTQLKCAVRHILKYKLCTLEELPEDVCTHLLTRKGKKTGETKGLAAKIMSAKEAYKKEHGTVAPLLGQVKGRQRIMACLKERARKIKLGQMKPKAPYAHEYEDMADNDDHDDDAEETDEKNVGDAGEDVDMDTGANEVEEDEEDCGLSEMIEKWQEECDLADAGPSTG